MGPKKFRDTLQTTTTSSTTTTPHQANGQLLPASKGQQGTYISLRVAKELQTHRLGPPGRSLWVCNSLATRREIFAREDTSFLPNQKLAIRRLILWSIWCLTISCFFQYAILPTRHGDQEHWPTLTFVIDIK